MSFIAQRGSLSAVGFGRTLEPPQFPLMVSATRNGNGTLANTMVQDTDGSMYVGGRVSTPTQYPTLSKFNVNGGLVWSVRYSAGSTNSVMSLAIDSTYIYAYVNSAIVYRFNKSNGSNVGAWQPVDGIVDKVISLSDGVYAWGGNSLQLIPSSMTGTATRYYSSTMAYGKIPYLGADLCICSVASIATAVSNFLILQRFNTVTKQALSSYRVGFGALGASDGYNRGQGITDSSGNIYFATYQMGPSTYDLILSKFNTSTLTISWSKTYTVSGSVLKVYPFGGSSGLNISFAINDIGQFFLGCVDSQRAALLQINTNDGSVIWNRTITSTSTVSNGAINLQPSGKTIGFSVGGSSYGNTAIDFLCARFLIGQTSSAVYSLNTYDYTISAPTVTVTNYTQMEYNLTSTNTTTTTASGASATDIAVTSNGFYFGPYTASIAP